MGGCFVCATTEDIVYLDAFDLPWCRGCYDEFFVRADAE